ncbi:MAG TPA: hypothetical protein VE402_03705, partial [Candidatus Angelobacter sp.]|nr:hypothetical protein [Candidatus Angelobacter sp.]
MRLHRWMVLAMLGFALLPSTARPEPAEFLPAFHASYEDLESLAARGALGSFSIHTRPLARMDVARALIQAK